MPTAQLHDTEVLLMIVPQAKIPPVLVTFQVSPEYRRYRVQLQAASTLLIQPYTVGVVIRLIVGGVPLFWSVWVSLPVNAGLLAQYPASTGSGPRPNGIGALATRSGPAAGRGAGAASSPSAVTASTIASPTTRARGATVARALIGRRPRGCPARPVARAAGRAGPGPGSPPGRRTGSG